LNVVSASRRAGKNMEERQKKVQDALEYIQEIAKRFEISASKCLQVLRDGPLLGSPETIHLEQCMAAIAAEKFDRLSEDLSTRIEILATLQKELKQDDIESFMGKIEETEIKNIDTEQGLSVSDILEIKDQTDVTTAGEPTIRSQEPTVSATGAQKKKRGRKRIDKTKFYCRECGSKDTPEWRRGPEGKNTLCNACGLQYSKRLKMEKNAANRADLTYILNPDIQRRRKRERKDDSTSSSTPSTSTTDKT